MSSDFQQQKDVAAEASSLLLGDPSEIVAGEHHWRECFPDIIGRSPSLLQVLETVSKIASSDSAVLICGESGTGKELIAGALHRLSSRSSKRFVAINCSAIPESLLESELFGHEKGAFTGAVAKRQGLFEQADGGTLFLDEIGDMPQRLQAKLLRVLQEKQFTTVGGSQLKAANVRIVAATNVNLEEAVNDGRFRLDLYYRLNVLPIVLPALRDRSGDVSLLLEHFMERAKGLHPSKAPTYLTEPARAALCSYSWPGNIRELQNVVERLVIMRSGQAIDTDHLPSEITSRSGVASPLAEEPVACVPKSKPSPTIEATQTIYPQEFGKLPEDGIDMPNYIETLENKLIIEALDRTGNNKNRAAKLLGLNRTTLVERIKKRKIGFSTD